VKKLDIGSGRRHFEDYITLDKDPKIEADVTHDIEKRFPFPDNTFDEIRASHILEHIHTEKKTFVMYEIWRVLKPCGIVKISVPSFPSPQSVIDPGHISFWHKDSFMYYEHGNRFRDGYEKRTSEPVPSFEIVESELINDWHLKITLKAIKEKE